MKTAVASIMGLALLLATAAAVAATTSLTWHGHATFEVVTPKGQVLMIDPWLNNPTNPGAGEGKDPVAAVKRLDYILITHAHADHVGDAVALAKRTGARLVTNVELGGNMAKMLGFPADQMGRDTLFNIGGEIPIAGGEVTVALTPAVHSSGLRVPHAKEHAPDIVYGGNPAGIVLRIQDGPTIYHTGDTAFFLDMQLIGEQYAPDVALINIGGHFGMMPDMAARAAGAVKAKLAIPHHFGTFPMLTQDAAPFLKAVRERGIDALEMKPGQTVRFKGTHLAQ